MPTDRVAPWRTGRPGRPEVAVPPRAMPLLLGRRPLKRWRWVGVFGEDVLLCAAVARIGPAAVSWWAVWDRGARTLAEHTVRRTGPVRLESSQVEIEDGLVSARIVLRETAGVETISPHGEHGYAWTRKQGGVPVTGAVTVADRTHDLTGARAIVDDSAGYHARHTAWQWSAGVGETVGGVPVAWNLVAGLHDAPEASERTVWVDGVAHEVGPLPFHGIDGVGDLRFTAEATRTHREDLLLVATDYEQPFGTFAGELPVAGRLAHGLGVMERHRARW